MPSMPSTAPRATPTPPEGTRTEADGTGTVRLHRVFAAPPARVFKAFTEPAAFARWLPPFGFTAAVELLDVRVGGRWRMSFTALSNGHTHHFGGEYREVQPAERLVYTATFDDPNLPGEMCTAVTLRAVDCGTELAIAQAGIPAAIPVAGCVLGWQDSLEQLKRLVEVEMPG